MAGNLRDRFYCGVIIIFFLLLASSGQAQTTPSLTFDSLQNGKSVELDKLDWKYVPGDDPQFADPQFDDRAWETLHGTAITLNNIPKSGWRGIGWFRLRLQVDPALTGQPLALVMVHFGASEIYLDGKLVQRFGAVGTTPETEVEYNPNTLPFSIVFDGRNEHVIAVRYSCATMPDLTTGRGKWFTKQRFMGSFGSLYTNRTTEYGVGFGIKIGELKQAFAEHLSLKSQYASLLLRLGMYFAIGLIHLLLYWFYPRQRANLFFGLFACLIAVGQFTLFLCATEHYGVRGFILLAIAAAPLIAFSTACLVAFVYTAFPPPPPKGFLILAMAQVVIILVFLFNPPEIVLNFLTVPVVLEALRVVIRAIWKRVEGAWIIGVGMLFFAIGTYLVVVFTLKGSVPVVLRFMASMPLLLSISIYLARNFARTSLDLETQLVQVEELSAKELEHQRLEAELRLQHAQEKAENDRRARELEEARQLQLSMLPKKLPNLPHLDIAAYMKTASEVGGDYYDFHTSEDGMLTIAVGDATGHGLKAGTMVSVIKGLFVSLAYHPDIPHIFQRQTRVLKEMKLRGLFMAMTMVKLKENHLSFCIAGMPPLYIYRAATNTVEEIFIKALPLGGIANYQYQQAERELASGDVVVMMSDGLPERFNDANEMFDYGNVRSLLASVGNLAPQEMIDRLVSAGDEWAGTRAQDDDVTFVVLKMK